MKAQMMIMKSGAALLLVGVLLVAAQLAYEIYTGQFVGGMNPSGLAVNTPGGLDIKTSYAGTMIVGIGAALLIVGWLAARPWKGDKNSN